MIETETNLKLRSLRYDNGGEYLDGELKEYYVANGIRMEKTIPGIQQNDVAESMNRTVNKCARNTKLHSGFPKTY